MANLRKVVAVVMGFMACVACLGLAACGSDNASTASSASGATSTEVTENTQAERLDAPADTESIAIELLGQNTDTNFADARVTAFANKTADGATICQVYLFSADGKHDAYVAFDYETKAVHGMDVDENNVIPYDTVLMGVL